MRWGLAHPVSICPAAAAGQIETGGLPRGSGDERGDYVSGVPVQAGPRPVVAHRGARVGVGGGFLHVAERDADVEGGGDEGMAQGVRADMLVYPGAAGSAPDDAGSAVPFEPPAIWSGEQRSFRALADRQVDRAGGARGERDRDDLAAFAGDDQGPVAAFQAEVLDVRAGDLRYPKSVEGNPLRARSEISA